MAQSTDRVMRCVHDVDRVVTAHNEQDARGRGRHRTGWQASSCLSAVGSLPSLRS